MKKESIIRILATLLVAALLIALLSRAIKRSVYEERQEMLSLVTGSASDLVDENFRLSWDQSGYLLNSLSHSIPDSPTLEESIRLVAGRHDLGGDYFFFVDTEGKYYASDGSFGKLTDFKAYGKDTPDKLLYISTLPHMDQMAAFNIYRTRLEEPLAVNTSRGPVRIAFFAFAQDPAPMRKAIANLFPGGINIFVYDNDGSMLYKEFGIKLLIDGYNIYPKFGICRRVFGENPQELERKCREGEDVVIEMVIDGSNFYFCSSPLKESDWSMALVVKKESIEALTGSSFTNIIAYIVLLVLLIGVLVLYLIQANIRQKAEASRLAQAEKLASALADASKAKTDFLSNMSHDIRTPINGIMGVTTIAMASADNPDKVRDCLHKIDGASRHLLSLINDVLDMSRIESGKTVINPVPVDLEALCDNCASIVQGQMQGRDLEFTTQVSAEHTRVLADDLHIRQILINILGNSVKFTRDGGKISFLCREDSCAGDSAVFSFIVEDTGIGMSPEFLEHIFESFTQENGSDRSNYKGTGLGMAITKSLTDLMDGTIDVQSEQGKGSRFSVTLTLPLDNTAHEETQARAAGVGIDGVKILLVEDNELNREIAVELLSGCGAVVDTAEDGQEALEKFGAAAPLSWDVILMDVMMPRMNGLEATRAIRALEREDAARIPIIAMTANAFDDDVKATKEAGMNAHLSKPIDIAEVVRTVAAFVNR